MSQRYDEFGDIAVDPTTGLHRLGANGPSLATAIAVAGAVAQLVLTLSANKRTGVLVWISLALVLGLGSATLAGTDVRSLDLSPQPASCEGAHCVCRLPVLPI